MRRILLVLFAAATLFAGPPRRVVSQTVGTDDLLMAIAAPGQVAALSHLARDAQYGPFAGQARAYSCLKTGDAEDILRFRPDLVLAASYTRPETLALLRRVGVQVLVLERFERLADLYANARRIGKALGREARAEALVKAWQARVAALDARLKGVRPVRVLAAGLYPFLAGSDTTFHDLCEHAGALNVAAEAGLSGHVPLPSEQMLRWKVDLLIVPREPGMDLKRALGQQVPYRYMEVLKQGRLLAMPNALMASTSQARLDAYEWLAKALHPERFP